MNEFERNYLRSLETIVSILLLSFPVLMLTVLGGMNAVLFASVLLALLVWLRPPAMIGTTDWKSEWTLYVVAMFAMTAAILISQTFHQSFSARHYDGPARYWLAIPIFLLLRRLNLRAFSTLQFAFPIAAIVGWALAKDMGYGVTLPMMDKIRYGDSMLLLGSLSLFSLDWLGKDAPYLRTLKWAGFALGLFATFQSGTRGALLAIPVFVAIYLYARGIRLSVKSTLASLVLGVLVIGLAYLSSSTIQHRLHEMAMDVTVYNQGNRDTSTGIRWQLYQAAASIIIEHPVFGVGPGGFALQMAPMADAGKITPMAAELGRGEVHNDILKKTADLGIFGLAAIFAVYLVPFCLFGKASKSKSRQIQRAGILGMVFVSGFMVFGLTAEVLNLTMTIAFYSFTVAVLLAYCYNIHHAEQGAT
ncbi:MAG: O-antigen ligase family protein [Gallionella sp.]|nr:O-antigen ligase family protein [Gallionella sp.]